MIRLSGCSLRIHLAFYNQADAVGVRSAFASSSTSKGNLLVFSFNLILIFSTYNTSVMGDKEIKNLRKENADLLRKIEVLQKVFASLKSKMAATDEIPGTDVWKSLQEE